MSFLVKALFIVIASILFILVIAYFSYFQKETAQQKIESDFKIEAMNVLQKLINDGNCLAYVHNGTPQKGVIDINKLNFFVSNYGDIEPECAKALGFDYNVKVIQFPYNFSLYPGEITVEGPPMLATDFAQHECNVGNGKVLYVRCNFLPSEEVCGGGELDPGSLTPICGSECYPDPLKNCPYPGHSMCCIPFNCPQEKCECIPNEYGYHPWIVSCDGADLEKDCTKLNFAHSFCGKVVKKIRLPAANITNISVELNVWNFGLTAGAGVSQFSPEKALQKTLTISIPISIRYNETFLAEGVLYMYAAKGELESLNSLLEDICDKAEHGVNANFSKDFHFSYPVNYTSPNLCMLDSCKKFVCSFKLDFEKIGIAGDYTLNFLVDDVNKAIIVKK